VGRPNCPVNAPHGNAGKDKPFTPTNLSVLEWIKTIAAAMGDKAGPAKLYKEAIMTTDTADSRKCPRDLKQVCAVLTN